MKYGYKTTFVDIFGARKEKRPTLTNVTYHLYVKTQQTQQNNRDRRLLDTSCQIIEATVHQGAEESDRAPMMTSDVNGISSTEQQYSDTIEDEIESFDRVSEVVDLIDTSSNLIPSNVAMANKIYDGSDNPREVTLLSIGESAQAFAASRIFASATEEEDDSANRDCSAQNNSHHNDDDDKDSDDDEEFEILPNLANLVAASLRDRVVLEQMEEIKLLKKQLKASRKVEITGKDGMPVYARGDFTKGQFNSNVHSGGQGQDAAMPFWDVGLKMKRLDDDEMSSIPLQNLKHIEIWIGGVLYCTSEEVEGVNIALGIRPGNCFDYKRVYDMKRSVVCEFNPQDDSLLVGRNAFLTFHMTGFPRDSWRSLQSVAMLNRSNVLLQQRREEEREERRDARQRERLEAGLPFIDDNEWDDSDDEEEDDESEPFDVYSYIANSLSRRHPEQRVTFTSVSFCVKSVRSKIKQLRRDCEVFEDERDRAFELLDEIREEEEAMMAEYL